MMQIKEYIEKLPFMADKKNSLMDIREYLSSMGFLEQKHNIIHIAGTNGKGSTVFNLSMALSAMGYRVGSFISPHLIEINERICINMQPVSDEVFENAGKKIKELTCKMIKKGFYHPTYFEFLFYMAMQIFMEASLDFIVLETGLGGRLDTTNVIENPILSIITSISMDHMAYLGNTLEEIAAEKAGIIKEGVELIYDDTSKQASRVILDKVNTLHTKAYPLSNIRCDENVWKEFDFFNASYKKDNAGLSMLALYRLKENGYLDKANISYDALQKQAISVWKHDIWQGRMHEVKEDIILDGAHNEAGIGAFAKAMQRIVKERKKKAKLLLSIVSDKEIHTMLGILKTVQEDIQKIYISGIASYRSSKPEDIYLEFDESIRISSVEFEEFQKVEEAFTKAKQEKKDNEILFVCGSLYLVGEVLSLLREA